MQPIAPTFTTTATVNAGETLVVTSPERLVAMATALAWKSIFVRRKLSLQMDARAGISQQAIEKRLNFWLAVCGCQAGGLCVLAALAWYLMSGAGALDFTLNAVLYGCAIGLGAGIVGKIAVMLGARMLFVGDALLASRRMRRAAPQGRFDP